MGLSSPIIGIIIGKFQLKMVRFCWGHVKSVILKQCNAYEIDK